MPDPVSEGQLGSYLSCVRLNPPITHLTSHFPYSTTATMCWLLFSDAPLREDEMTKTSKQGSTLDKRYKYYDGTRAKFDVHPPQHTRTHTYTRVHRVKHIMWASFRHTHTPYAQFVCYHMHTHMRHTSNTPASKPFPHRRWPWIKLASQNLFAAVQLASAIPLGFVLCGALSACVCVFKV